MYLLIEMNMPTCIPRYSASIRYSNTILITVVRCLAVLAADTAATRRRYRHSASRFGSFAPCPTSTAARIRRPQRALAPGRRSSMSEPPEGLSWCRSTTSGGRTRTGMARETWSQWDSRSPLVSGWSRSSTAYASFGHCSRHNGEQQAPERQRQLAG